MPWDESLTTQQQQAASHQNGHARLIAGPGTGKTLTLTRHVCYLIEELNIEPNRILVLTFTRAATQELRQRITSEVGNENLPLISTLHSFALRQLLRNSRRVNILPSPLRIADDWEERNIIQEDLKRLLNLRRIEEVKELLLQLTADWQSLAIENENHQQNFSNPRFIGAWQEHRNIFGYTLRSELVYQLKRAFEQYGDDFELDYPVNYLIVDEYQDLNRCDLAVIREISNRGAQLYIAGDDDQSIYGFRKAHPEGIRHFDQEYHPTDYNLEICKRCAENILNISLFVAAQDPRRIPKNIRHENEGGEVYLLRFDNQNQEAIGIAQICRYLINEQNLNPEDILILLRSDNKGVFSSILIERLAEINLPANTSVNSKNILDTKEGRKVLSLLRLLYNRNDDLALRTYLQIDRNGIGSDTLNNLYQLSLERGIRFNVAVRELLNDHNLIRNGQRIRNILNQIDQFLEETQSRFQTQENITAENINSMLDHIINFAESQEFGNDIKNFLLRFIEEDSISLENYLRNIESNDTKIEQELETGCVNILTMHKAKGLTAEATIIVGAEDEYIPGRSTTENEIGDERRLLYVSMTRAKKYLYITYCLRRTGQQRHTGTTSGSVRRHLTRFLRNAPITPQPGLQFISNLRGIPQ